MFSVQSKQVSKTKQAGFSILEVLLTAGIIALITAIIAVRYGDFNARVLLNSQAYELALDLREVQTLSVSARGESTAFREEFGLYFNTSQRDRYQLFRDNDSNGAHVPARYHSGEALGEPAFFDRRYEIASIVADGTSVSNVAISFRRPNFDARMYVVGRGEVNETVITLRNTRDTSLTRSIGVTRTGQIDVR